MDQPSPERCASLKAHKSLPRRRAVSDELDDEEAALRTKSRKSYNSPAKEARITSWIIDSSPPTPTNATFLMPLTPPGEGVEAAAEMEDGNAVRDGSEGKVEVSSHRSHPGSGSATPVNNRSPPTPELTPPRKLHVRKRSPSPPLRRKNRISLSPPPASRQASSRAESFRTALEGSPRLTSESVATFHTMKSRGTPSEGKSPYTAPEEAVGLGLGLSDDEMPTPRVELPAMVLSSPSPAKNLTPKMVQTDPLVAGDIPAIRELELGDASLSPRGVGGDEAFTPSAISYTHHGDSPFRDATFAEEAARHVGDQGLAESDLSSRRSVSPLSDDSDPDPLMARAKRDSKRFSQISNLSTPQSVEVVVIDSSPVRKHKLRHSSKNTSLRAASSTQGGSNRSSLQSSADVKPGLNSMLGAQNSRATGSSLHSDSGISMAGSDHIMKRWSKMKYMDIPRRAPSVTRSLPFSSQRYIAPHSPKHWSRPSTAPDGAASPTNSRRSHQKALSETTTLTREYERTRGRTKVPPAIPKRGSSLGAPTGREQMRGTAAVPSPKKGPVEAIPKHGHNRAASQPVPKPRIVVEAEPEPEPQPTVEAQTQHQSQDKGLVSPISAAGDKVPTLSPLLTEARSNGSDIQSPRTPLWMRRSSDASDIKPLPTLTTRNTTPRRSSKDDTAMMASRALLKTPFSGMSIQSSASGFMEVHEATAVNIYPHTNSSLLVIQQPSDEPMDFPAHPGVRPANYRMVTDVSTLPDTGPAVGSDSVHVMVNGPDGNPVVHHGGDHVLVRRLDSPLQNPRPAPSPRTAKANADGLLPAVNLIPPTPLDGPAGARASANKATLIGGPVSLVRRALTNRRSQAGNVPRTSGLWLSSGRKTARDSVTKKRRSRPVVGDNNLSPFWRPRRFWEDSDETNSEDEDEFLAQRAEHTKNTQPRNPFYQLGSGNNTTRPRNGNAERDYFGNLPIRNTLGFPQQRIVVTGPASLVRRLSSIRRRRNAVQAAWADPKLNPSGSPKPPTTLPEPGAGSSTNLTVARASNPRASPSPSAMSQQSKNRRKKSNAGSRRKVRFEFHPMRGLSGGSGESKEWRTKGMVKKLKEGRDKRREEREREELERIEQRRRELRGLIGMPRLKEETTDI